MGLILAVAWGCGGGEDDPGDVPGPPEKPACGEGELHDGTGCVPEACGPGPWGREEGDGASVYVDAAAPEGGDGSPDWPFDTVGAGIEALADAGTGGRIAVAAGTYPESFELRARHSGITVAGRCADLVVLDGSGGSPFAPLLKATLGADGTFGLAGVRVEGARYCAAALAGGTLTVEDAVIADNRYCGVYGAGTDATAVLRGVTVRDSLPDNSGEFGRGLDFTDGARLVVEDSRIEGHPEHAIRLDEGARGEVSGTTIVGPGLEPGPGAFGISVRDGASLSATSTTVTGARGAGLLVVQASAEVTSFGVLDTAPDDEDLASAVEVGLGGELRATDLLLEGNRGIGLYAYEGSVVTLTGFEVRETLDEGAVGAGRGLQVQDGAVVEATDCAVVHSRDVGAAVFAAELVLTGCEVRDGEGFADGMGGIGILVVEGGHLRFEGGTIAENDADGLSLIGATAEVLDVVLVGNGRVGVILDGGSGVSLERSSVIDSRADGDGHFGVGLSVDGGSEVTAVDCLFERNREVSVHVVAGSRVTLEGCTVASTALNGEGTFGVGVGAGEGASVTLDGCTVRDNHTLGVSIDGATATVLDSTIEDTGPDALGSFGAGVTVQGGGSLTLVGSDVLDNHTLAVEVVGSIAEMDGVLVAGTDLDGEGGFGFALKVVEGSAVEVSDSRFEDNRQGGLVVDASTVTVRGLEVSGVIRDSQSLLALGVVSQESSVVDVEDLTVDGCEGPALYVCVAGRLTCTRCALGSTEFAAAVVWDGELVLADSTVGPADYSPTAGGGVGVYAGTAFGPPRIELSGVRVEAQPLAGIYVDAGSEGDLPTLLVRASELVGGGDHVPSTWPYGTGLFATGAVAGWDAALGSGLLLEATVVRDAAGAGLFLDRGASVTLAGMTFSGNTLDLVQQRCTASTEAPSGLDETPDAITELCPPSSRYVDPVEVSLYPVDATPDG